MTFIGMSTHASNIKEWNILIALAFAACNQTKGFCCIDDLMLFERMGAKASILTNNLFALFLTIVDPKNIQL